MKAYLDITLLPNDDIGHHFLWSKLYQQLHLSLVETKVADNSSIFGIAFPEYKIEKQRLGRKLRIFSPDEGSLAQLDLARWFERLHDYLHLTRSREVPDKVNGYACFYRPKTITSVEKLARRAVKRHSVTYEQALADRSEFKPKLTSSPFIHMKSLGSGNRFPLFISKALVKKSDTNCSFSTYGLSKKGALPMF